MPSPRVSCYFRHLTTSPQSLLARVAAADPNAARACIAEYGPLVWSIARRMSPSDAEAAVHDIFLELWHRAREYDAGAASEATFIAMIARRRLIARQRRAAQRPQLRSMPDAGIGEGHDAIERCVEASLATSTLAALDPRQRRVLSLAIGHGLTADEIAQVTDMSSDAVKSLVRRALVAVRKRVLEFHEAVARDQA